MESLNREQGRIQVLRKGGGAVNIFNVACLKWGGGVACMSILCHSYRDFVIFETKIFVN